MPSETPSAHAALVASLAVLLVAAGAPPVAPLGEAAPRPGVTARPCRVAGVDEELRCYGIAVHERPGEPDSRRLVLNVVVLPALRPAPRADPLVLVQGGPGVAGVPMARPFALRAVLREDRDIIVFDPRGTGASNRLSCDAPGRLFFGRLLPADHLAACRNRLAARADLSQYTSTATAHDLEAIRRALGYEALNVWGFSFGTRVAMAYAREYPNRVRALVLDGVVPFDVGLTADLAETLDRALETVLERCAHDAACHAAHGDVRAKVRALAARLDRAPAVARLDSDHGAHPEVRVGRWELAYAIRGMLYGDRAAAIPAVVHRAHSSGNLSEIAALYAQRSAWPGDSTGLAPHLGAYCSEDLPFIRRAEVERRTRGTLMGPMYYEQYRSGCEAWPVPRATPRNREPLRAAVPTLLFSGERDPVTPPEYGARVLQYLPRATHVLTPGGGHAVQSPCKARVVAAFLAAPAATPDTGCLSLPGLPPFEIATSGDRSRS